MARLSTLVFAVAIAVALVCGATSAPAGEETTSCDYQEFQCNDGSCVEGYSRCDGDKNCGDDSDEAQCDALIGSVSTKLADDATVVAHVQFKEEHDYLQVFLCGGERCSVLELSAVIVNRELGYNIFTGCDRNGFYCSTRKYSFFFAKHLPEGEMQIKLQRQGGYVTVSRPDRNSEEVKVPVGSDYDTVWIRPFYWNVDLPVTYSG